MAVRSIKPKRVFDRINVRVEPLVKERVSRAASLLGQDLTEFTVSTLNEKAIAVIDESERFELTQAEKDAFFEILDRPAAKPTKTALDAARRYKRLKKDHKLRA
ncbi:MAG: DUF1778 domain-containing protein [Acidobacteriota bacterium]|nr:MAG: DUF1778 domain-containing protein [Acidobacteriota bacterium]